MNDRILTVPEVAKMLKLSKAKVYAMVQRSEIPHIRLERNVRIWEKDLLKYLEKQTIRSR